MWKGQARDNMRVPGLTPDVPRCKQRGRCAPIHRQQSNLQLSEVFHAEQIQVRLPMTVVIYMDEIYAI